MTEVAKNHTWMRERLVSTEQRFAAIEKELRRLAESPSTTTNEAPAFSTEPQKP
jgi:hypothetical protein